MKISKELNDINEIIDIAIFDIKLNKINNKIILISNNKELTCKGNRFYYLEALKHIIKCLIKKELNVTIKIEKDLIIEFKGKNDTFAKNENVDQCLNSKYVKKDETLFYLALKTLQLIGNTVLLKQNKIFIKF